MIFAQHGSRRAPHVFFDVLEEERYSDTLDRHFAHRVLRIGYNYKGLTEIGGLVLRPEFRRHPERLGRQLAFVRFLYLARHRSLFHDEVLSELMPPLEPDGTSLLWESLGRRFTGLTYQDADRLSQTNKEFIRALFPQDPIYATLLPTHVQALIGQVGPETKGVEKLLLRGGVQLRAPDRPLRRRAALPRPHRRHQRRSPKRTSRTSPTPRMRRSTPAAAARSFWWRASGRRPLASSPRASSCRRCWKATGCRCPTTSAARSR